VSAAWLDVCALDDLVPDTGECALVGNRQIALVRVGDAVYAIDNFDPFSRAYVLSRGIVGCRGGVPKLASPMYKQSFSLVSGECLDDASVKVDVYPARVRQGRVELQVPLG
jgi:nitrite reductase (NADH) small subunit